MTNAMIIFNESIKLMEEGTIGTTGRTIEVTMPNGETKEFEEPEEIHTYQAWKSLGYQVQKGEKAVAQFTIWKHVTQKVKGKGKDRKTNEIIDTEANAGKMFMTKASFFKASQVAPIQ